MPATENPFLDNLLQFDVELDGHKLKMPIAYRDAASVTAIFPARYAAARRLLPHPAFHLLELAPKVAAVAVTVFEYRDCDIGPYNELAISFPVAFKRSGVPVATLLQQVSKRTFSAYVRQLPVTTEIARVGGVEVYGFPKIIADINFTVGGGRVETELRHDNRSVLRMSGPAPEVSSPKSATIRYLTHAVRHGRPVEAQVLVRAEGLFERTAPSDVLLDIDTEHPIGRELADVLLARRPVLYYFVPSFSAILHAPTWLE